MPTIKKKLEQGIQKILNHYAGVKLQPNTIAQVRFDIENMLQQYDANKYKVEVEDLYGRLDVKISASLDSNIWEPYSRKRSLYKDALKWKQYDQYNKLIFFHHPEDYRLYFPDNSNYIDSYSIGLY